MTVHDLPSKLDDAQWFAFFTVASEVLGPGNRLPDLSQSWCSWTTFDRLEMDAGYWTGGLPVAKDIFATYIGDHGVWGQPFHFYQLAHLIVPRKFLGEELKQPDFGYREFVQNLDGLSDRLHAFNVPHRLTGLALEIKCF